MTRSTGWVGRKRLARIVAGVCIASLCFAFENGNETGDCSNADFNGRYGFQSQGVNLLNNATQMFAGTLRADGKGRITEWKDWVATPLGTTAPPAFKLVELRDIFELAGRDMRYVVERDCRITISANVVAPVPGGRTPLVLVGALADGGREALMINGSPNAPFLTTSIFRRTDASDKKLKESLRSIQQVLGIGALVQ